MKSQVLRLGSDVVAIGLEAARAKGLGSDTAAARKAIEAIVRCHAADWSGGRPLPPPPAPPITGMTAIDNLLEGLTA